MLSSVSIKRLNALLDQTSKAMKSPKAGTEYLPSRLLDVNSGSDGRVRLATNKDVKLKRGRQPVRYMALSYCWGSEQQAEQQLKTTSSSLRRHLNRISISKLPKTVADAVQLCKALGIRYLWVDALCIIQDDKDDWAQEASEMANVYSNSHVTLCILRGSSCLEGFLESKYAPKTLGVKFSSVLDPAVTGKLYLRMLRPPEETIDVVCLALKGTPGQRAQVPGHLDFENSVWQTRAWTFQEARLSPRKLYVGEDMFHMSCGSVHESADGSGFFDGLSSMGAHDDASFDHMQQWYGLVSDYAKRNLTYEKDRFPAFAAIAKTFSDRFPGDEYVAGLWKSDLHRGLLWTPGSSTTFEEHFRLPDHGYVAPSWSWAHRRHSVAWVQGNDDDKSVFIPECEWQDISIVHSSLNPFGSIASAHIRMSARAMQLFPPVAGRKLSRAPDEEVVYLGFGFYFTIKSGTGEYMADLHLDWLLLGCDRGKHPDGPIDELWMVLVASSTLEVRDSGWAPRGGRQVTEPERMLGLLVLPTGNADEFIKVGLWYSEGRELGGRKLWDGVQERSIKLV